MNPNPFEKPVEGMLQTRMVKDTAVLMQKAVEDCIESNILINNQAGGKAPFIAQRIVEEYLAK
ncbi:MAG: hypothetical protein R6U41_11890 [Desulfosalsimonas sp.]|uniref:hypothetical protein n=1 Tax=Desulfosalsimonas sp. TaxID=3073848 RepID=UPI003970C3F7